MTDPEDGDRRADPSGDPSDEPAADPFEYDGTAGGGHDLTDHRVDDASAGAERRGETHQGRPAERPGVAKPPDERSPDGRSPGGRPPNTGTYNSASPNSRPPDERPPNARHPDARHPDARHPDAKRTDERGNRPQDRSSSRQPPRSADRGPSGTPGGRGGPPGGGGRGPPGGRGRGPPPDRNPTGASVYIRDVVTSVGAVLIIGLVLFAISGIWPPMVAVESGSMEPNMVRGDLVFVMDNDRLQPDEAPVFEGRSTGVVPADRAVSSGRTKFGGHGDVIVFRPDGNELRTPIIHRAMLWVEADEDWYDRADEEFVGDADNCNELDHCPAPHAGFITLGDANPNYDQERSLTGPVRPAWIIGTAELRVPYLGYVRLVFSESPTPGFDPVTPSAATEQPTPATTAPAGTAVTATGTADASASAASPPASASPSPDAGPARPVV